jgi:hypothetical protein
MDFAVFQSWSNEALSVGQGLFAEILRWHLGQVSFTDLDIVAKNFVKPDPQRSNAGTLTFLRLEMV